MKKISDLTKSFSKDVDELEKGLQELTRQKAPLVSALKDAGRQLSDAQKQFSATHDEAAGLRLELAQAQYDGIKRQLNLVTRAAKETESQLRKTAEGAETLGQAGDGSMWKNLESGVQKFISNGGGKLLGELAMNTANTLVGSALGDEGGSIFASMLSMAVQGASIGTMVGGLGVGTAAGAAIGGIVGLASGKLSAFQSYDDAFKSYYPALYDNAKSAQDSGVTSGSAIAAGRETDLISFSTLFGDRGTAEEYLKNLVGMANTTPFLYGDLTAMSKTLATYGYGADSLLPVLRTVGDTGAALGMSTGDMTAVATALGRMKSSDKATLEYLNILNDRGVGAVNYLADAKGVSVGDMYSMISKGEISGGEAAEIILEALAEDFSGSMLEQSKTFEGLSSTLEGLKQEIENAAGEGYNNERSRGLQAEITSYSGALGQALQEVNALSGQNRAYLENLSDTYQRQALSMVLTGTGAGDYSVFSPADQAQLAGMREAFLAAQEAYEKTGSLDASVEMEHLSLQAQAIATAAYEASEQYKLVQDAESDSLQALRDNTSALQAATSAYALSQERTKGMAARIAQMPDGASEESEEHWRVLRDDNYVYEGGVSQPEPLDMPAGISDETYRRWLALRGDGFADGLRRVPYDNFPALLHRDERVLTASEARGYGGGGGVTVTGNTFHVRQESDIQSIASELLRQLRQAQAAGVY